jgi:hypothetical protein
MVCASCYLEIELTCDQLCNSSYDGSDGMQTTVTVLAIRSTPAIWLLMEKSHTYVPQKQENQKIPAEPRLPC